MLIPYANALAVVERANYSWPHHAETINRWLRRLARLDNSDWKPVAIWLVRTHSQDPDFLASGLERLEQLAASMNLLRMYATPRASRYAAVLRELEGGAGVDAPSFRLSDTEKRRSLLALRGPIYEVAPVRKYVLLRLNELVSSAPVDFSPRIITVEHVLPQHPAEGSEWRRDFDDDGRDYWVHRLANLVLLDRRKNSEAQNYDFAKKATGYFKSASGTTPFPLTVEVMGESEWLPSTLEERQERLSGSSPRRGVCDLMQTGTTSPHFRRPNFFRLGSSGPLGRAVNPSSIPDLVAAGRLSVGALLRWERPNVGALHVATVTDDGSLRIADGREFKTPVACGGGSGWYFCGQRVGCLAHRERQDSGRATRGAPGLEPRIGLHASLSCRE